MTKILLFSLFLSLSAHAQTPVKTLVIIGDSLTEGYGVAKEKAYPALLEEKLKADGKAWKIINSGVSGSTAASALSRVKWAMKSKPDLVMIALGANDGLRGIKVETTKKNLDDAMAELKKAGIPMIIGGMQMPANFGQAYTQSFKVMFSDLSKKYNATLVPFLLEGVAGDSKLNQADGIHPNEEGQKILADTVYKHIRDIIK